MMEPQLQWLGAIVLAGGQSTRMGQDKALIPIQGVPLLRRVCEVALQCTPLVYVVTSRVETYAAVLPPDCHLIREFPLPGTTMPQGPLVGFAQALAVVPTEWVLLLACDLPHLNPQILQQWATILKQGGFAEDLTALLPRSPKGWEPLCGFYRSRCLPRLVAAIAGGERSFQQWLRQERVAALPLSTPDMLFNCNTPADLSQIERAEG